MPLQNNQSYTGTVPCLWTLGNQILSSGSSATFRLLWHNTFWCLLVNITTWRKEIQLLFSLSITIPDLFKSHICLFQNGFDLEQQHLVWEADFSNGFTIGNPTQRYNGNLPGYLPSDKVSNSQDAGYGH